MGLPVTRTNILVYGLNGFCSGLSGVAATLYMGSGNPGTVMTVEGSWFEACFHEGMAWSGEGRSITVTNSVAMNCGQGIEAGWSGGRRSAASSCW